MGTTLSKEQAQALIDAHEINLDDGEESDLLLANNSALYEAYEAIIAIASEEPSR